MKWVRPPRPLPGLLGVLLALSLLLLPLGTPAARAVSLPWQTAGPHPAGSASGTTVRGGLQEVAPPQAVQQLQEALADHEPVVEILSPQNDAVLGGGPWTLRLRLRDWPLVEAGELGLGPHLVVQLDQEPPRRWTALEGELPELSPGSHLLTVFAALPWGEALRNPGAVRQIRVHRTAANPLSVPEAGSPQLLAVSPAAVAGEEPLLFDVLLLDAPLQNVGGAGIQWRLRLTVNGDDVLLEQQTPLWLRGWRAGVNALKLELLDARGNPLNPPFNSLVREVDRSTPPPRERWRGGPLSEQELGVLIGRLPVPAPAPATVEQRAEAPSAAAGADQPTPPSPIPSATDGRSAASTGLQQEQAAEAPEPAPAPTTALAEQSTPATVVDTTLQPPALERPDNAPEDQLLGADREPDHTPPATTAPSPSATGEAPEPPAAPATATASTDGMTTAGADADQTQDDDDEPPALATPPADEGALPSTGLSASGEARIAPSSSLAGRARDLVNDDGTLRRPEQRGPLAALREKLQG